MTTDEQPRILVIARRDDHKSWIEAIGKAHGDLVVPGTPLYGSRFDLILVALPVEDRNERFHRWWEQDVLCRLSRTGKIVMWA